MKKILTSVIFIVLVHTIAFSQGTLETAKVYSRLAFTEWRQKIGSWRDLKKIHSVVIDSWTYNSNTGRYLIVVEIKWEVVGFVMDETFERTFTLKCDTNGCSANIKPDNGSLVELECIEK